MSRLTVLPPPVTVLLLLRRDLEQQAKNPPLNIPLPKLRRVEVW